MLVYLSSRRLLSGFHVCRLSTFIPVSYTHLNAHKMLNYIEEHGLSICGDYLCEVLVEFPVFQDGPRNMFYKLEIPVNTKK